MTLQSIISKSIKVPDIFLKVTLGVGFQSPLSGGKKVLLFGNKTSAGTATVEEVVAVTGEDLARTLFGAGSELFWMCKYALEAYKGIQLFAIPVTESAGASAELDLTFTGGPTTAAGVVTVRVYGRSIQVPVDIGDSITDVAAAVAAGINDETDWPVTATSAAGVVTVTAKQAGPRGNHTWLESELDGGDGVTFADVAEYLASGATSDDPQDALDAAAAVRYQYLVAPYQDSTNLAKFDTHVTNVSEPTEAKRARFLFGSVDTLAATTTVAGAVNAARGQCGWEYNSPLPPSVIASVLSAELAERYESNPASNCNGLRLRGLLAPKSSADYPTFTEQNSALNNGISPIVPVGNDMQLVRSVTTYHQDDGGNPDFRVIDVHKVEVADFEADKLEVNWASQWDDFRFDDSEGDNPTEVPDPGVATKSTIKDWIYGLLVVDEGVYLTNVTAQLAELIVEADPDVAGRVNASIPLDVIELLHQGAFDVRQVG